MTYPDRNMASAERGARAEHELRDEPSIAIVEAIADRTGRDATDLPPLQDTVDVDALNALVRRPGHDDVRITFEYDGLVVTADGDGDVEVDQ
jgi:hypothetical protein